MKVLSMILVTMRMRQRSMLVLHLKANHTEEATEVAEEEDIPEVIKEEVTKVSQGEDTSLISPKVNISQGEDISPKVVKEVIPTTMLQEEVKVPSILHSLPRRESLFAIIVVYQAISRRIVGNTSTNNNIQYTLLKVKVIRKVREVREVREVKLKMVLFWPVELCWAQTGF